MTALTERLHDAKARRNKQIKAVKWTIEQHRKGRSLDDIRSVLMNNDGDDAHVEQMISAAAEIIADELTATKAATAGGWLEAEPWPDANVAVVPPIEALPSMLRDAVLAISAKAQCPDGLALPSVLAGCAAAASGAFDVQFDYPGHTMTWPLNEYFLTLALSGERKSSAAKYIDKPLLEYERELLDKMRLQIAQERANAGAWKEKQSGIYLAIRQAAKRGDTEGMRSAEETLLDHEQHQPGEPLVPGLLIGSDFTKERLLHDVSTWPIASGNSAEAGGVLSGYSMGAEQRRGTITTLCSLFDGKNPGQRRVGDGKSVASGDARLTLSLAMQPGAWRETFRQHGDLITDIGLTARLLLSEPQSGIGTCRYTEPPQWTAAAITTFQDAMMDTLRRSALPTRDQQGGARLELQTLRLDPDAAKQVFDFMLATESRMSSNGELTELTGHGRRVQEHACRLAASMAAVCSQGQAQSVSIEYAKAAISIVEYYLAEAIRLTSASATPTTRDARRLESWLVEYGGSAARTSLLTRGPLRDRARLDAALAVLVEKQRARQFKTGKKITIEINPDLKGGKAANPANAETEPSLKLATLATLAREHAAKTEPTPDEINRAFDIGADEVEVEL